MTWTAAARRRALEAYRAGAPVRAIAAEHSRSVAAVREAFRRWGEPARRLRQAGRLRSPPEVVEAAHDLAVALVAQHGSVRGAAEATGLPRSTLTHALHRHEVGTGTLARLRAALGQLAA